MTERQRGNMDLEIGRGGLRIHFTNTPKWAYILISIGIMLALVIWAHSFYSASVRMEEIKTVAEKLVIDEPLTDDDVILLESMDKVERKAFETDVKQQTTKGANDAQQIKK